jgi:hypothetical protein
MTVARLGDQTGTGLMCGTRSGPGGRIRTGLALGWTGSGTAQRHRLWNGAGLPWEERANGFA